MWWGGEDGGRAPEGLERRSKGGKGVFRKVTDRLGGVFVSLKRKKMNRKE